MSCAHIEHKIFIGEKVVHPNFCTPFKINEYCCGSCGSIFIDTLDFSRKLATWKKHYRAGLAKDITTGGGDDIKWAFQQLAKMPAEEREGFYKEHGDEISST